MHNKSNKNSQHKRPSFTPNQIQTSLNQYANQIPKIAAFENNNKKLVPTRNKMMEHFIFLHFQWLQTYEVLCKTRKLSKDHNINQYNSLSQEAQQGSNNAQKLLDVALMK